MSEDKKYETIEEFWPFYLSEHQHPTNRALHFIGSAGALFWLGRAIYKKQPALIGAALLSGYGFAWVGHFFVEKNKPASFKYPVESFMSDWIMLATKLTGKLEHELTKEDVLKIVEERKLLQK